MIEVDEARGRAAKRRFTELPYVLFRAEKRWVAPPIGVEKARFDRFRNTVLLERDHVELLARRQGTPAGRLAIELDDEGNAVVTAYDLVDDVEVARALFDAAREWIEENEGTGRLQGPEVLVEGFDRPGLLGRPWHPPWYTAGLTEAGLVPAARRSTWRLPAAGEVTLGCDPSAPTPPLAGRYGDPRLVLPGVAAVPDLGEANGSARELLRRARRGEWSTAVVVRCDGDPAVLVPALAAAAASAGYLEVVAAWHPDPDALPETVHATFVVEW